MEGGTRATNARSDSFGRIREGSTREGTTAVLKDNAFGVGEKEQSQVFAFLHE
jgi:hypothetical protein